MSFVALLEVGKEQVLKGWKEKEGMGQIPGATACPVLSFPIYPGSASLLFGSWLFSDAPEGWIHRNGMEITHSPPDPLRDPRLCSGEAAHLPEGIPAVAHGKVTPAPRRAWKIPTGRGDWSCHSTVGCGIPCAALLRTAQELPQGLGMNGSSLAGKIICKRWRALPWAAGGGFGAFGSPSPEGIQGRDGSPGVNRCCCESWKQICPCPNPGPSTEHLAEGQGLPGVSQVCRHDGTGGKTAGAGAVWGFTPRG